MSSNINFRGRVLLNCPDNLNPCTQPFDSSNSLFSSRYYREGSSLTLDVGPYMKALEVFMVDYLVNAGIKSCSLDQIAKHNMRQMSRKVRL